MIYPKQQNNNKKEGINQLQILKKKTIHNDNLQKVVWNNILQKKVWLEREFGKNKNLQKRIHKNNFL